MLFLVFYIAIALLAAPIIAVVVVRSACGDSTPDGEDFFIGSLLGIVSCMMWPIALAGLVLYLVVQWLYRRVVQLEREMEELRRR